MCTKHISIPNNNIIRAVEMHMRMHQVVNYRKVVCVCVCLIHSSFRTFQHDDDGVGHEGHRNEEKASKCTFPKYYARGNIYDS